MNYTRPFGVILLISIMFLISAVIFFIYGHIIIGLMELFLSIGHAVVAVNTYKKKKEDSPL